LSSSLGLEVAGPDGGRGRVFPARAMQRFFEEHPYASPNEIFEQLIKMFEERGW
jgi:hypothetical protein